MSDNIDLYEDVKLIVSKIARIDPAKITYTTSMRNELMVDSLLAIQIIVMIQDKYNIKIDEVEIFNVDNITDIVNLINEYLKEKEK